MRKTIAIIATLDTKGEEVKYLKGQIEKKGKDVLVIDSGIRGTPEAVKPDISREAVARAAGFCIEELQKKDRGPAVEAMMEGIRKVVREAYEAGGFQGIISTGGQDGALLASAGMRELPIGVPKFILTPIAQGKETFGTYVGTKDIIMMHSVVDILGINEVSRKVFDIAVGAIVGMVDADVSPEAKLPGKKLIAVTMYGNTTPAVMMAKKLLEKKGYEVVVFHPNGTGGRAMEELVEEGFFTAVLDMTTHEITDELFDGLHAGGPNRLEAAGRRGVPQVVVPGCVDFILAGPLDTLPQIYKKRKTYPFNPAVTLVRVSKKEMVAIAEVMANKLNKATGPTTVLIPLCGFSMYCHEGEALYDPESDKIFVHTLEKHLRPQIGVKKVNAHINDPEFAEEAVSTLVHMIGEPEG